MITYLITHVYWDTLYISRITGGFVKTALSCLSSPAAVVLHIFTVRFDNIC